jgi:tetratricopeptide (TPR) repeat protein
MNKSLSLVITLTVVIVITVVITYFDIMNMNRKTTAPPAPTQTIKLTRHNQPGTKKKPKTIYAKKWNNKIIKAEGNQLIGQAYLLYRNGQLPAAEEKIRTALILLPKNRNALAMLGRILYETGRYDLAEQVFKAQAKLHNSATAYNNLGEAMARLGKYQQAIEAFNLAVERQPSSATINLNLAGMLSITGNKKQALHFFRQAFDKLGYRVIPVSHDPALNNIRTEPEFKKIIRSAKQMQLSQ